MDSLQLTPAYVAGFIDADGYYSSSNSRLIVGCCNTNKSIVDAVSEFMKSISSEHSCIGRGSLSVRIPDTTKQRPIHATKPCYVYTATGKHARLVIDTLMPYILLNRSKVDMICNLTPSVASDLSWAYVAGFFDGEGAVVHYPTQSRYSLYLMNTHEQTMKAIFGFISMGHMSNRNSRFMGKPTGRQAFEINIGGWKDQVAFIRSILPFSIVKRSKLENALAFIHDKDWNADGLSHIHDADLAEKYRNNVGPCQLAKEYGVSRISIHNHLKRVGVRFKPQTDRPSKLNGVTSEVLATQYAQVHSVKELGEMHGVSIAVMWKHLKRHGVQLGKPGAQPGNQNSQKGYSRATA